MKYYTSYYSKVAKMDTSKLLLVCISVSKPAWFIKPLYTFSEVIPSWGLVSGYKSGIVTQEHYEEIYDEQLDGVNIEDYKKEFEHTCNVRGYEGVVFLCWEGPNKFCHRYKLGARFNATEL